MPDNVNYAPSGSTLIASDDVGGIQYQRVKQSFGEDGTATDVSLTNPLPATITQGEIVECLEAIRMSVQSLNRTIGLAYPDTSGRMRILLDSITASLTLATVSTVTTVTTLTNQSQMGGLSAVPQIPAIMQFAADNLRRNITVN